MYLETLTYSLTYDDNQFSVIYFVVILNGNGMPLILGYASLRQLRATQGKLSWVGEKTYWKGTIRISVSLDCIWNV